MSDTAILYMSRNGATRQYAEWLQRCLPVPAFDLEAAQSSLEGYHRLVIGAPVYNGVLLVKDWLRDHEATLRKRKVFFFIVSVTGADDTNAVRQLLHDNIPESLQNRANIFFLPGRRPDFQSGLEDLDPLCIDALYRAVTSISLPEKYNTPVPRYTSYPTVPHWKDSLDAGAWQKKVTNALEQEGRNGISLYIHLPFCESLCAYCGCTKRITTNHEVEKGYIEALIAEWELYTRDLSVPPVIREIHLGGGTPTFFSPAHLEQLITGIFASSTRHPQFEGSLEGHPNNTTKEHLWTLHRLGFRRVSFGVQDLNPEVQEAIHRIQPFSAVRDAVDMARTIGYASVNLDLIYGLPLQDGQRLESTVRQSLSLRPDRLAFYSYAHVPNIAPNQRLIDERLLPSATEKLQLYLTGRQLFIDHGYTDIGMDHFALPGDELTLAWRSGRLHRNFMGYTVRHSEVLLGLGMSAISDIGDGYAQNVKSLKDYRRSIEEGRHPVTRGYLLDAADKVFRRHILDIACKGHTVFHPDYTEMYQRITIPLLRALADDGLVTFTEEAVQLTEEGRAYLRHVCRAFDLQGLQPAEGARRQGVFAASL